MDMAERMNHPAYLSYRVYQKVIQKLNKEPLEDFRIDFEDGFGNRSDKEEDTVVPRAELPRLLHGVKAIGRKYGFRSVCYGHAGDGNLHVNILKENMTDEQWNVTVKKGIREIFELCGIEIKSAPVSAEVLSNQRHRSSG